MLTRNKDPGESTIIARAFENSPPLISHNVSGLLPITDAENQCLMCHMLENAKDLNATPIPKTHFTNYRPKIAESDGKYQVLAKDNEVVKEDLGEVFNKAQYYCTMCHVPQSNASDNVENLYKEDFRKEESKLRSNLIEIMEEGVK